MANDSDGRLDECIHCSELILDSSCALAYHSLRCNHGNSLLVLGSVTISCRQERIRMYLNFLPLLVLISSFEIVPSVNGLNFYANNGSSCMLKRR